MTGTTDWTVRRLTVDDAEALHRLRREALELAPRAFSADVDDDGFSTLDRVHRTLAQAGAGAVFGAVASEGLIGMAGFAARERAKERHKGVLWGVYLRSGWRGRGIADRMVAAVIGHARAHVRVLQAAVAIDNKAARRVYHKLGFHPYGVERRALLVDGIFIDEELLVLDLGN